MIAWRRQSVLIAAICTKVVLHLTLISRYGIHRDEYYFVQCGDNLAWGYVDHPPFVPAVARLSSALLGDGMVALRLPVIVAGAIAIALTIVIVRRLGGGLFAEGVAATAMLLAPAMLRMSSTLNIPAFELVFWTGGTLVVLEILNGASARWWLAVGAIAGVGLLNKHTMLIWGSSLVVGLVLTPHRRALKSPWIWGGAAIAAALILPNLIWQATHGWPTAVFVQEMRAHTLTRVGRGLFAAGQLLYHNPFSMPLCAMGVVHLWRSSRTRPLAIAFGTMFTILLLTKGKPYYLTPAYPVVFAAGAVFAEAWLKRRRDSARAAITLAWVSLGLPIMVLSLPIMSLASTDAAVDAAFGWAVPPRALTHDMHDEYGWREQAQAIAAVAAGHDRDRTRVLTSNYGEASALAYYRHEFDLPRAVSGHMTHHLWGPGSDGVDTLIVYGHHETVVRGVCRAPQERARIGHPLAKSTEQDVPIIVCTPKQPLAEMWPSLRRFGHGPSRQLHP